VNIHGVAPTKFIKFASLWVSVIEIWVYVFGLVTNCHIKAHAKQGKLSRLAITKRDGFFHLQCVILFYHCLLLRELFYYSVVW